MGGVDKSDMYCALYGTSRKSKKWWHRILFGLIDRSLRNTFVVYKKLIDCNCTLLNFRRSVAQSLITLGKPPKVGRPISTLSNQLTANKRQIILFQHQLEKKMWEFTGLFMTKNVEGARCAQRKRTNQNLF